MLGGMTTETASIRVGRIEFVRVAGDEVEIRFHGKTGPIDSTVNAGQLERWAVRQLRDTMFQPAKPEGSLA
jgi:hypothetical protein